MKQNHATVPASWKQLFQSVGIVISASVVFFVLSQGLSRTYREEKILGEVVECQRIQKAYLAYYLNAQQHGTWSPKCSPTAQELINLGYLKANDVAVLQEPWVSVHGFNPVDEHGAFIEIKTLRGTIVIRQSGECNLYTRENTLAMVGDAQTWED